jgi:type VI secretion system protein ImpC
MRDSKTPPVPDIRLDVNVGRIVRSTVRAEDPFRLAVLGDFRGRGNRGAEAPSPGERVLSIDRDDFDDVLARCAPELRLSLGESAPEMHVIFRELDDFHPDRLYERLPLFRELRELRARLADPLRFRQTLRELEVSAEPADPVPPSASGGDLLDQIVGGMGGDGGVRAAPRDEFAEFVRRAVAPSLIAREDPRQPEAVARVDEAISETMRGLLRHPDFQGLESLWRGLYFLVRRVETGESLRLSLVDLTAAELAAELGAGSGEDSELCNWLGEAGAGVAGGAPWSVLIGCYRFGPELDELRLLRRAARMAGRLGAPWIAEADPRLVGCAAFAAAPDPDDWSLPVSAEWDELRRMPEAAMLGLAMPRFLLREPYGRDADECERFAFEEMDAEPAHEAFLWGNPAIGCAVLLAQCFAEAGWAMRPGANLDLAGLPLYVARRAGVPVATPCAEAMMSERAALRILDAGPMPLAWMKDRDVARLVRFQSIALPAAPLAGRWVGAASA